MVFVKLESESAESDNSESVSSFSETKFQFSTEEELDEKGHYVASLQLHGKLIGPYDVQILSSRFVFFFSPFVFPCVFLRPPASHPICL
jgi:hypothetical protein